MSTTANVAYCWRSLSLPIVFGSVLYKRTFTKRNWPIQSVMAAR